MVRIVIVVMIHEWFDSLTKTASDFVKHKFFQVAVIFDVCCNLASLLSSFFIYTLRITYLTEFVTSSFFFFCTNISLFNFICFYFGRSRNKNFWYWIKWPSFKTRYKIRTNFMKSLYNDCIKRLLHHKTLFVWLRLLEVVSPSILWSMCVQQIWPVLD